MALDDYNVKNATLPSSNWGVWTNMNLRV